MQACFKQQGQAKQGKLITVSMHQNNHYQISVSSESDIITVYHGLCSSARPVLTANGLVNGL